VGLSAVLVVDGIRRYPIRTETTRLEENSRVAFSFVVVYSTTRSEKVSIPRLWITVANATLARCQHRPAAAVARVLSDEEMAEYRRPFTEPGEGRRPTLTWPREIPIEGRPADVNAIAADYANWLGASNVPKLFFKAEPGAILTNDRLLNLVRGWPALTEKKVAGVHFV
jgi:hypothetical protein